MCTACNLTKRFIYTHTLKNILSKGGGLQDLLKVPHTIPYTVYIIDYYYINLYNITNTNVLPKSGMQKQGHQ